jgi:hypothetical protein
MSRDYDFVFSWRDLARDVLDLPLTIGPAAPLSSTYFAGHAESRRPRLDAADSGPAAVDR